MTLKQIIGILLAEWIDLKTKKWEKSPVESQKKIFKNLVKKGSKTQFGKDHDFNLISDYEAFKKHVPIRDYEEYKNYIDRMAGGESNVLWPGRPIYFCKSSGTTSGVKFLPISSESMSNHIESARNAILNYVHETGNSEIINGKMIFLQGSPELETVNSIPTGRLSGIVAHHVPKYLQKNRLPSIKTNCIKDWETKVDTIVDESINENMTIIGGIPPWLQMYFEKLIDVSGKRSVSEIFPNLRLVIIGGVNFEPYEKRFKELLGEQVDFLELYPASEGFFAYQNNQKEKDLLLLLNENIFYEFIPADEVMTKTENRVSIEGIELNKNYALVINSNAGFWGYLIGDTVKFTSLNPYKIVVTGRIKHFISAFGEHVIAEEVESAINEITKDIDVKINEFTVAPKIKTEQEELPYHEWFIDFLKEPSDINEFSNILDKIIRRKNIYYNDLIAGKVLQPLKIKLMKPGGFGELMKIQGKLGEQNKVIHLSNDRSIVEIIEKNNLTR